MFNQQEDNDNDDDNSSNSNNNNKFIMPSSLRLQGRWSPDANAFSSSILLLNVRLLAHFNFFY